MKFNPPRCRYSSNAITTGLFTFQVTQGPLDLIYERKELLFQVRRHYSVQLFHSLSKSSLADSLPHRQSNWTLNSHSSLFLS